MNNMSAAQSAQQSNRDNAGKYATKKVGEVEGVDLATEPVTLSDRFESQLDSYRSDNAAGRLAYAGEVIRARELLWSAATGARYEYGDSAQVLRFDNVVSGGGTIFSVEDINGNQLGVVEADAEVFDNSLNDVKIEEDVYSIPAALRIDVDSEAKAMQREIVHAALTEETSERVTLTDEEREALLSDAEFERILAAREQALREEIAGEIEAHGALWDHSPDWRGGTDEAGDIARGIVR